MYPRAHWPDDLEAPTVDGGVVLLSAEDDEADTIRPRLDAAYRSWFGLVAILTRLNLPVGGSG